MQVIAILGFWLTMITFCYLYFTTRHKERMTLIEKGLTAEIFNSKGKNYESYKALKTGVTLLCAGIGFGTGVGLMHVFDTHDPYPVFFSLMIFGGLGLIGYYMYTKRLEERETEAQKYYRSKEIDIPEEITMD